MGGWQGQLVGGGVGDDGHACGGRRVGLYVLVWSIGRVFACYGLNSVLFYACMLWTVHECIHECMEEETYVSYNAGT